MPPIYRSTQKAQANFRSSKLRNKTQLQHIITTKKHPISTTTMGLSVATWTISSAECETRQPLIPQFLRRPRQAPRNGIAASLLGWQLWSRCRPPLPWPKVCHRRSRRRRRCKMASCVCSKEISRIWIRRIIQYKTKSLKIVWFRQLQARMISRLKRKKLVRSSSVICMSEPGLIWKTHWRIWIRWVERSWSSLSSWRTLRGLTRCSWPPYTPNLKSLTCFDSKQPILFLSTLKKLGNVAATIICLLISFNKKL